MTAIDVDRSCYVIRIVFDGAALAGKTTNLMQLCALVPSERRTELYAPGSLRGRTMFFDWVEVVGPTTGTRQVMFQLITVPGQVQRNYRRRPLVEMADVIVFVVDCSPERFPESFQTFQRLSVYLRKQRRRIPLIVQANKQDAENAMTPEEVRTLMSLSDDVSVIPASSLRGTGVRETLVTAMRLGRELLIEEHRLGRIRPVTRDSASADGLFESMLAQEATHPATERDLDAIVSREPIARPKVRPMSPHEGRRLAQPTATTPEKEAPVRAQPSHYVGVLFHTVPRVPQKD